MGLLIAVVTFVTVLSFVIGTNLVLLVIGPEYQNTRELRRRLAGKPPAASINANLVRIDQKLSSMKRLTRLLMFSGRVTGALRQNLERAGLTINVGTLVLASGLIGMLMFALLSFVTNMIGISAAVAAGTAVLPFLVVRHKAAKRIRRFEEQFPEAIDLISRALRAGHALTSGLSMVATEMSDPVGTEIQLLYERQKFGMRLSDAMRMMTGARSSGGCAVLCDGGANAARIRR